MFRSALQRIPVVEVVVEPSAAGAAIADAGALALGLIGLASEVEMRSQHVFPTIVQPLKQ